MLVVWIVAKDKQFTVERKALQDKLSAEQAQRVRDAQKFTSLALELQAKVHKAIDVVSSQISAFQQQNTLLERIAAKLPAKKGSSDGSS